MIFKKIAPLNFVGIGIKNVIKLKFKVVAFAVTHFHGIEKRKHVLVFFSFHDVSRTRRNGISFGIIFPYALL